MGLLYLLHMHIPPQPCGGCGCGVYAVQPLELVCLVTIIIIILARFITVNSALGEGSLRLVNSTSTNASGAGRLEIYLRGEWGTVCDDNFDADVACRQLGYPSASKEDSVGVLG